MMASFRMSRMGAAWASYVHSMRFIRALLRLEACRIFDALARSSAGVLVARGEGRLGSPGGQVGPRGGASGEACVHSELEWRDPTVKKSLPLKPKCCSIECCCRYRHTALEAGRGGLGLKSRCH